MGFGVAGDRFCHKMEAIASHLLSKIPIFLSIKNPGLIGSQPARGWQDYGKHLQYSANLH
ncbi:MULTISPECIES: hypothetical protein [Limnospira]|uniref:hypothetical protein n=1 Tax=Limnospira TaxID=2596745 RepID=UPI0001D0E409|nr:hypothetical protein [Arthrospira platensis FACHB-439]MBD2708859.1 hypothetical protein [Arthrospira platensis FACHB-835]MDF2209136.1 hypothetical protein [Arthrospira platensis NCB002]MDT9181250.1 hypothetical protein [Limnospira sp. PMC 289.06]MDT9293556.1 hypothetical protein [Arthrospira platensis PCC 7345]QQW29495.1 hypothetical protein AP9108_00715 [Arthrospira sp. PCC 9108]BAI88022.1 hypothetical protein NIES39_A01830 [Arthrospira platensis NIES-39]